MKENKVEFEDIDKLTNTIMRKFAEQWNTLQKAFNDMCKSKEGNVKKYDLEHLLEHWGFHLKPKVFEQIFQKLDYDKDGVISYQDLQNTVG